MIAHTYISTQIMPHQHAADAVHLAFAVYYKADILLTWNCRHLANPNKFRIISEINTGMGLYSPILTTPYDLRIVNPED